MHLEGNFIIRDRPDEELAGFPEKFPLSRATEQLEQLRERKLLAMREANKRNMIVKRNKAEGHLFGSDEVWHDRDGTQRIRIICMVIARLDRLVGAENEAQAQATENSSDKS